MSPQFWEEHPNPMVEKLEAGYMRLHEENAALREILRRGWTVMPEEGRDMGSVVYSMRDNSLVAVLGGPSWNVFDSPDAAIDAALEQLKEAKP